MNAFIRGKYLQGYKSSPEYVLLKMFSRGYHIKHELLDCALSNEKIPLKDEGGNYIIHRPDFYFGRVNYIVNLDGEAVHGKIVVGDRDAHVNRLLPLNGYTFDRFPFSRVTKTWFLYVYNSVLKKVNMKMIARG